MEWNNDLYKVDLLNVDDITIKIKRLEFLNDLFLHLMFIIRSTQDFGAFVRYDFFSYLILALISSTYF